MAVVRGRRGLGFIFCNSSAILSFQPTATSSSEFFRPAGHAWLAKENTAPAKAKRIAYKILGCSAVSFLLQETNVAARPLALQYNFAWEARGMETFEGGLEKDQAGHRDFI